MKKAILGILAFLSFTAWAQKDETAIKYSNTITIDGLFDQLNILASDALEGRDTGSRGLKMAAALISNHFENIGLSGPVKNGNQMSYYQNVPLVTTQTTGATLQIKKNTYSNFEKVVYAGGGRAQGSGELEVVFVGNGSDEALKDVDLTGKAALAIIDNPRGSFGFMRLAKGKGAALALSVTASSDEMMAQMVARFRPYLEGKSMSLDSGEKGDESFKGLYVLAPSLLKDLTGKTYEELSDIAVSGDSKKVSKVKKGKVNYNITKEVENITSENVLGYLEGSDLKDELVVLTAHYDHLGKKGDKIYNGADDDGSGTAAIMEIAEAFAKAKDDGNGPRRSMLFLAFTGEEKGLLGSEYYAANPTFPLENTVTNLNIDMIGRNDEDNHRGKDYVCLVGSDRLSTELHQISENANATYMNLDLNYVYNDINHPERIYYRSDHWNFAKNGIPVIFYTTGSHPDYHQHTDTVEKIEKEVYLKRTQLVFFTAWELVNRDTRPVVDKSGD